METLADRQTLANWNGELKPLMDVNVSVLDRAFLFGESVYEVTRIYSGRAWRLDDHLQRLEAGLRSLRIEYDLNLVKKRILETAEQSGLGEALAYVQITRGTAIRRHRYPDDATPNCLIWIEPPDDEYAILRKEGAKAVTYPDIRWSRNDIKCTSLAANCMAADAAHMAGCAEAIFIDRNGMMSEGSHSSIFAVTNGRVLVTPTSSAVLPGITKRQLIELCTASGISLEEGRISKEKLSNVDELFLTATPEEIIGIVEVDGEPIGGGITGPVTRRLQEAFSRCIEVWLAGG